MRRRAGPARGPRTAAAGGPLPEPPRAWPLPLELALVALLGAGQTLAFVRTAWWALPLATTALLAWRLGAARPGRAAALGWTYGCAWLLAGTWWLYVSMHDYGGLAAWMAALAVAVLCGLLSLYMALAAGLHARWRSGRPGRDAVLFGALWLLAELARGVIFTGFPWVASGYAQVDGPLTALAPWVGVYGIGAVGAGLAAWLGLAFRDRGRPRAWLAPAAALAVVLGGLAVLGPAEFSRPAGAPLEVSLLQGNVPQDEKFSQEALPATLDWVQSRLLGARGALVVGPETVVPLLPAQLDPDWWAPIARHFGAGERAALLGMPLGNDTAGYTNSAVGLAPGGAASASPGVYRYDKHHLVPFGEFIPNGFHWFTALMNIPLGDFNRGGLAQPPFVFRGERVAPDICYEDLFGEEIAAGFRDPALAPTLLANLSNIGWFGDTIAIPQHLRISRMRTLELQRPMLRATNTGATAVIDHRGRVTAQLAPLTQGVLEAQVQGRTGITPFAWWAARFGLWPAWVLGIGLVWGLRGSGRASANEVSRDL